jgi:hypothetical protein
LSLIAIHFVGLPTSGALVSVPTLLPELLAKLLFVVSKYDPPTTVMPPLAVSRPLIVVVRVTARVLGMEKAPPEVTEKRVDPLLLVPFVTINEPDAVPR